MKFGSKQVRLAVAPIAWINDDIAELANIYTLEQCLAQSAEAGFSGIEAGRSFPENPKVLLAKLQPAGLELVSGWWSGGLRTNSVAEEIERIDSYIEMFIGCGAEMMFYGEMDGSIQVEGHKLSMRPIMAPADFKAYGARLSELARYMKKRGIKLCYHHHMGTVVQSAADVDLLMTHTSSDLGLLVDTGHIAFAGDCPVKLLRKHAARVCYIHCKDLRKDKFTQCIEEDWAFTRAVREGVFTVPGDGYIDFEAFIKELASIKYGGWIVVEAEQDPRVADPLEYSIMGREHLESLLDQYSFNLLDETAT